MKKLLVLFVAVAATISSFAASKYLVFNRSQFQWRNDSDGNILTFDEPDDYNLQLTVPFVYKGTVSVTSELAALDPDKCVITKKSSYPAIMTICQPCIDCFPCQELEIDAADNDAPLAHKGIIDNEEMADGPGWITVWNLYVILDVDKKFKRVTYSVIDLVDLEDPAEATFFTGAKKGNAYFTYADADSSIFANGPKSDYKFKYYVAFLTKDGWEDKAADAKAQTAYIKSAKSFNGTVLYTGADALSAAGTIKLTRNSSWTDKAIKGAFQVEQAKGSKGNWEDCDDPIDAATCEEYLTLAFDAEYFGTTYKNYEPIPVVEETVTALFEFMYDLL